MCNCTTLDTYCNPVTGCECHPGYYGSDCSNINECENDTTCDIHSTCVDLPGSFRCDCHDGYTHFNATVCEGIPWLPVVLGTLLGLVLLILLVILCIFILCCRGRGKNTIIEDSPEHDSSLYYSSTGPMRQMIWQQRTPTMMSPSNAKVNEHERGRMNNAEGAQYERERMN
ncbi:hypothetical protein LSAT2_024977, partial [Lamellibrachia satsuma]